MKKSVFIFIFVLFIFPLFSQNSFLEQQKKYERVRVAFNERENIVKKNLSDKNLSAQNLDILLVAYKAEKQLDIFGKKKSDDTYKLIVSYDICRSSGVLGPKRKQGDYQVPEGFYFIDNFNSASTYYLSLGINYPQ